MLDVIAALLGPTGTLILVLVLVIVFILWFFLPFAVFGTKPKIDALRGELERTNRHLSDISAVITRLESRSQPAIRENPDVNKTTQ